MIRSTLILVLLLVTIVAVHGTFDLGLLKQLLQRKSLKELHKRQAPKTYGCAWICDVDAAANTFKCIEESEYCDIESKWHCKDGTDEKWCSACWPGPDGKYYEDWCDEKPDGSIKCHDYKDQCNKHNPVCTDGYDTNNMTCCFNVCDIKADYSSKCLKKGDMCDGIPDCQDGGDEDPKECERVKNKEDTNWSVRELRRLLQGK